MATPGAAASQPGARRHAPRAEVGLTARSCAAVPRRHARSCAGRPPTWALVVLIAGASAPQPQACGEPHRLRGGPCSEAAVTWQRQTRKRSSPAPLRETGTSIDATVNQCAGWQSAGLSEPKQRGARARMVLNGTSAEAAGPPSWRHTTLEASPWHALQAACDAGETDDAVLRSLEARLSRVHGRPGGLLAFTLEDALRSTLAAVSFTWLDGKAPAGSHWATLTAEALRILAQAARKQHNARKVRPGVRPPGSDTPWHSQPPLTGVQHLRPACPGLLCPGSLRPEPSGWVAARSGATPGAACRPLCPGAGRRSRGCHCWPRRREPYRAASQAAKAG